MVHSYTTSPYHVCLTLLLLLFLPVLYMGVGFVNVACPPGDHFAYCFLDFELFKVFCGCVAAKFCLHIRLLCTKVN